MPREWRETTRLVDAAGEILEQEHPMTIRQLFYRLVSAAVIENTRANYRRVSKVMTKADSNCRNCRAAITWAKSPNGTSVPLDARSTQLHFKSCSNGGAPTSSPPTPAPSSRSTPESS